MVRSVHASHACIFQYICGNESQPGLQILENLAMHML